MCIPANARSLTSTFANCEILLSARPFRVRSQNSPNSQLMSSAIISKQLASTPTVSAADTLAHICTHEAQTHTGTGGTHSLSNASCAKYIFTHVPTHTRSHTHTRTHVLRHLKFHLGCCIYLFHLLQYRLSAIADMCGRNSAARRVLNSIEVLPSRHSRDNPAVKYDLSYSNGMYERNIRWQTSFSMYLCRSSKNVSV